MPAPVRAMSMSEAPFMVIELAPTKAPSAVIELVLTKTVMVLPEAVRVHLAHEGVAMPAPATPVHCERIRCTNGPGTTSRSCPTWG